MPAALYTPGNVVVGQAVLYVAPSFTSLPPANSVLFDSTNWTAKTISFSGSPTAGTFTPTVVTAAGSASVPITYATTLTAATVQTALAGLSNVGTGNVTVTGTNGGPFTVSFASSLGGVSMTVASALTGGTTPTVSTSGGLWIPAGATEGGWSFGGSTSTNDINIEEQSTPVGKYVTARTCSISGALAEDTVQSHQWALNMVKSVAAATTGVPATTTLTLSDTLSHYAVALETINAQGFARRYYIPDTVSVSNVTVAFRRAAANRSLPVSFDSVCATSLIVIQEVTSVPGP
jgi:hypothetical protein